MMKEGIFAGYPLSLLHLALLALGSLALALNPLHSPLPRSPLFTKMAKCELKRENAT